MEEYDTDGKIAGVTYYDDKGRLYYKIDSAGNIVQRWVYGDSKMPDIQDLIVELRGRREDPNIAPEQRDGIDAIIKRLENLNSEPNVKPESRKWRVFLYFADA